MQKMKTNMALRNVMKAHKVVIWQLADMLGVSEMTVNRMLRHEMPEEKQSKLIAMVEVWAKENKQ